ncbi:hypothetical protein BAUCODRAFT_33780 [Baudoinia panamericana UAMH 10762]|uniref:PROP1-like PPR domain-containing protein n=1 Tax=Baudoinia panamericana (strain UAMH 10762) TaxID=717646 RepID=M2LPU7_BAUPA|nr:uncharacterized protein BAUCODRAFT_33780 [Baudoinia panamericana UAMH 10762]EMC96427.1 hypothetical protein BAUCODRAFT_33780 [Baudoinia panamericana UAMH 10762]
MLERVKDCFKSGAQQSRRCAQSVQTSRRMLHSAFWHHGSVDLDLPPWANGVSQSPSDLPLKRYDDQQLPQGSTARNRQRATIWATPADEVFLDFLYPPQALAMLRRASTQNTERWERRNAKRLPEGFVQATRSYTSRSYAQAAQQRRQEREQQEDEPDIGIAVSSSGQQARPDQLHQRLERLDQPIGSPNGLDAGAVIQEDAFDDDGAVPPSQSAAVASNNTEWSPTDLADSPADLAETQHTGLRRLRSILAASIQKLGTVETALELYDNLNTSDKDDRLKTELLIWLCNNHGQDQDGQVRCMQLYQSIQIERRSLPVYVAALSVYLRRGLHVQAVRLHREALTNIENGDQVTKAFFEYAINSHRWQLAINIEAQYRLLKVREMPAAGKRFWLQVSQIPRLLPKALALANHARALKRAKTFSNNTRRFCAHLFAEALTQEFRGPALATSQPAYKPSQMPKKSIGRLFAYLKYFGPDAARLYETMILALLEQQDPANTYRHVHRIVSYVYEQLRQTKAIISQNVLLALLDRLLRYNKDKQRQRPEAYKSIRVATIINTWELQYGKLSSAAVKLLLETYSASGRLERFQQWMRYSREHYPSYKAQRSVLVNSIYVHARRADLHAARIAFEEAVELTAAQGEQLPLKCYNVLIHAQSRVDDFKGASDLLQSVIKRGMRPDEFTFHPIMQMLAKRGDVDGVRDLLMQYDALAQKKREVAFTGSLITALINRGEIDEAETVLKDAIVDVKTAKVRGSLTGSFNIVLTGHALRRDTDATMRVYRWMMTEGIRPDAGTFAALIQLQVRNRRATQALAILKKVMRKHGVVPNAFHYALVMTGFVRVGRYNDALRVYDHMKAHNVKRTPSSNIAYLKAKALKEHAEKLHSAGSDTQPERLDDTIAELSRMLGMADGETLALKQPSLDGRTAMSDLADVSASHFSFLIYIHGRRRCFQAVEKLCRHARKLHGESPVESGEAYQTGWRIPLQLLAALMSAHLRAKEYDEVERCWKLAKERADDLTRPMQVPPLERQKEQGNLAHETEQNTMSFQTDAFSDAGEVGFSFTEFQAQPDKAPTYSVAQGEAEPKQASVVTDKSTPSLPAPVAGRQHILARHFGFYLQALAAQSRTADILSSFANLIGQGYVLDNFTWNLFVRLLCNTNPPLILLAFTLVERFLIPHFPGWAPVSRAYVPNPSARAEGLEYIRARHLRPGQLMPQYETFVVLGSALLKLRQLEAAGRKGLLTGIERFDKYVGSFKLVREQAPRTLYAVQSMPKRNDALQTRLLGRR